MSYDYLISALKLFYQIQSLFYKSLPIGKCHPKTLQPTTKEMIVLVYERRNFAAKTFHLCFGRNFSSGLLDLTIVQPKIEILVSVVHYFIFVLLAS